MFLDTENRFSMNIGILVKFRGHLYLYQMNALRILMTDGWYQNRSLWNSSRIPIGNLVGKGVDFTFSNLALHFADFISLFSFLQFNVIFEQLLPLKTFEDLKRKLKNCNQLSIDAKKKPYFHLNDISVHMEKQIFNFGVKFFLKTYSRLWI